MAAAIGSTGFVLYVKTLAPTLLMADPAEFQLACYTLGLAHPTGYPLYLLLGWLWSHLLPIGDPAYRVNLLSAVFAAAALGLFYLLVLRVVRTVIPGQPTRVTRSVAVLATLTLAVSRTFWSQALTAEVYALNSLFVVVFLFALLRWSESRSPRALQLAALTYGLSLTHHSTMILFLPSCILFLWLTDRSLFKKGRLLLLLVLLVLAPLLLYLYIPWRAPATAYLYLDLARGRRLELYQNTLRGFVGFLAGETFMAELGVQAPPFERLIMAGGLLLRQFGIVGVALGLLGLVKLSLPRQDSRGRRLLALLGLAYVALVAFTLLYNVGDIHVFYTPSYIIFAVWMGLGLAWLADVLQRVRLGALSGARGAAWALVGLFAVLPVWLLCNNYRSVDQSDNYEARAWAEGILSQPTPEGSILISNDRNEITPLLYLQHVEGVRPDLLTMFPLMLPGEEYSNVVRVIDGVLEVGRPLYLVKPMPGLEIKYQMEPVGTLVEVTGPAIAGQPEHALGTTLNGSLTLLGYDLDPNQPLPGDELRVALYWRADGGLDKDYHTYIHLLDQQGGVIAQSDHRPGGEYYPSSLWKPGETLLDQHTLSVPGATEEGVISFVAGAYEYPSLVPLASAITLGQASIGS